MRYLKKYNESLSVEDSVEIIYNCEDILLELNDVGINTTCEGTSSDISIRKNYKYSAIEINIDKGYDDNMTDVNNRIHNKMEWSEISEVIFRLIDYFKSLGYNEYSIEKDDDEVLEPEIFINRSNSHLYIDCLSITFWI